MTVPPYFNVEGLISGYQTTTIIRNLSFSIERGEIFAILGKNGMGKSTLLKSLMGFIEPSSGRVELDGKDITHWAPHVKAKSGISNTPQEYTLFQDLTVEENLALAVPNDRVLRERFDEISEAFPIIAQRFHQRAGTLSGGEQKMLLLSRALLSRPRLMFIDEITEGLQPSMVFRMAEVLERMRAQSSITILLIEQNLPFALRVADRYAILKLGEIVESDATAGRAASELVQHLQI